MQASFVRLNYRIPGGKAIFVSGSKARPVVVSLVVADELVPCQRGGGHIPARMRAEGLYITTYSNEYNACRRHEKALNADPIIPDRYAPPARCGGSGLGRYDLEPGGLFARPAAFDICGGEPQDCLG
jgi:hypothetical protein